MADPMHDDPANWTRGPIKLYFARDDRRLIVPKYHAALGWTFNFAHPAAPLLMAVIVFAPIVVATVAAIFR
jgi:uncharacterized membrane protein